jgi:hypothetical protein
MATRIGSVSAYCNVVGIWGRRRSTDRGGIVSALSSAIKGASVAGRANGALHSDSLEPAAMDADRLGSAVDAASLDSTMDADGVHAAAVDAASLEPALMMPTKSQQFSGQI